MNLNQPGRPMASGDEPAFDDTTDGPEPAPAPVPEPVREPPDPGDDDGWVEV
ncbi:hypothetical protein [Jiangella asiatica]|uniref:hypothetical protein n=1 Tax=Jiangella asiatica TaxID=2530372 RepID=UPI0013A5CA34|nr:hypothetical protein [Jiangella asiatica]